MIEGLLFISGDEGIELKQICEVLEVNQTIVLECLELLKKEYQANLRGFQIVEMAENYYLTTKPEHAPFYQKYVQSPGNSTLSQAALETLAIIAYRQPITRMEIEEIRGVKSEKPLQTLVRKQLVEEVGRAEGVGRARLYGTTKHFLEAFGLISLDELPPFPKGILNSSSENEMLQLYERLDAREQEEKMSDN